MSDPVGAGFVDNVAQPGGNTTGFMLSEYSLNAKLLELLKQIAPIQGMAVGMRGNKGSIAYCGDVPEPALIQVR